MNILIIEDEPQAAKRLHRQLAHLLPDATIQDPIASVQEATMALSEPPFPDLIFMDIHLADGDSFEILDQLSIPSPIVFTTAYDSYALQAFKANSIDYLLKPIRQHELAASLDKWKRLTSRGSDAFPSLLPVMKALNTLREGPFLQRLLIRFPERIKAIHVSEAAYFYVESRVTLMQLHNGKQYPVDFNLDQLEKKLNPRKFFRANRKFIVSVEAIHQMHTYSKSRLLLDLQPSYDGDICVSSEKSAAFKRWLMGG